MSALKDNSDPLLDLCLASPTFPPTYSGPAIRFLRYAPLFRERRVDMRVLTTVRVGSSSRIGLSKSGSSLPMTPELVDGIPVHRIPVMNSWGKTRSFWHFERTSVAQCRSGARPDVVQLLSMWEGSSPYWIRKLRSLGIPVVYTHTMVRDPTVGRVKNLLWLQSFRAVDCTVVSTEAMRDSLRRIGHRGMIRVIPNGVDTKRFRSASSAADKHALRLRLGIPPEAEVIVFVGGFLIQRKGVDLLADAWARVASKRPLAHLLLVGPTYDSLRLGDTGRSLESHRSFLEGVKSSLNASRAMDRVSFAGSVENVEDYLRAADVFVFPSRREGMPNVVFEAYATSVPSVLCPFIGISKEFGIPGTHYLRANHDASEIAERILELLADESQRTRLGNAAREWVFQGFRTESSVDAYCELYRELAACHRNLTGD